MRNDEIGRMARNVLAVSVVWTLLFSGMLGFGASLVSVAAEDPIEPTSVDWTIDTPFNITDDAVLDGNLTIAAGGNLTIIDGGLSFASDALHRYHLDIEVDGSLNLINSYITVETKQINPYYVLPVTVAGTLYGEDALLKFPGFINVTGTMILWDSVVTNLGSGYPDDYNDAPVFHISSDGEAHFYRTSISPLFTRAGIDRTNAARGYYFDFNVTNNAEVWFVDSYLDIDYSDGGDHNEMWARDSAQIYAYNLNIDTSEPTGSRVTAIRTSGNNTTAKVSILRWADVLCVDKNNVPIEGVTLSPRLVQNGAPEFPDSGGTDPHKYILNYLGKNDTSWKVTGPDGRALLPLPSEHIDGNFNQTEPNSEFYGQYNVTGQYGGLSSSSYFSFNPYPAMDAEDGTKQITLDFNTTLPRPDLDVTDIYWVPSSPEESQVIDFYANITNKGGSSAINVYVNFYVDGQELPGSPAYFAVILPSETKLAGPISWPNSTGGDHSISVVADPMNLISESNEANNDEAEPFHVIPLLPDYEMVTGNITFPANNYIGNPVRIDITVGNPGSADAPSTTVDVYIGDPTLGGAQHIGQAFVGGILKTKANLTHLEYTFSQAKDYKICVWVDKDNIVTEEDEDNNIACKTLTIDLAPNLAITSNDIGVGDLCTRMGQTVTPQVTIRNIGYVDAGAYEVIFRIDGDYFASGNSTGLSANGTEVVTSDLSWTPTGAGLHGLTAEVDPNDNIKESTNLDNLASKDVLIFHDKVALTFDWIGNLPANFTFDGNVDITGRLTVDGKSIFLNQADPLTGRYCIKITGTGSLILKNGARLYSNFPLVIYVSDSASLVVDDSDIELDSRGVGGLYADKSATIDIENSGLYGNLFSTGDSVSLKGVELFGSDLYIETADTSDIWDCDFPGVQNLFLLSDDGNVDTVDFDIRNVTFDESLDIQLVFKGNQLVELTSVITYVPEGDEWWTGMVTEKAKVRIYWWLTVKMVDGTGSVLQDLTPLMDLETLDETNLAWMPVDMDLSVPDGQIVLRVLSEEMQFYPVWGWTNSTYAITGRVELDGSWFYPDTQEDRGNWTGDVRSNMEVKLTFPGLTPDFSVSLIVFDGENGQDIYQPLDRLLQINATIYNGGNIAAFDVEVMMYHGGNLIGYDVIDIPALGSAIAVDDWTPTSVGSKLILVCVDDNNTISERNENNNCQYAGLNVFGWPDLSIDTASIMLSADPVEGTPNGVTATVRNLGTSNAVDVQVTFEDDDGWSVTVGIDDEIAVGAAEDKTVQWTPQSSGTKVLTVTVDASNDTPYQVDYNWMNNVADRTVLVLTLPDLYVHEVSGSPEVTVGVQYSIGLILNNSGGSMANYVSVVLILDQSDVVCQKTGLNISAGGFVDISVSCPAINEIGNHTIRASVDPDDTVNELDEDNNTRDFSFDIVPPTARITITTPVANSEIDKGRNIFVEGWVVETDTDRGIGGVHVTITLETTDGVEIGVDYAISAVSGELQGKITTMFVIPDDVDCGNDYRFTIASNETYVESASVWLSAVECPAEFPFWMLVLIIIIIIVIVIVIAITAYIRVFGLGKLVECGECGAFIPEDSTACPKCGVQFETETAKCSNCQAWVPLNVKKCPECGVEFATGEVEMEDYKAKMRMQYDEVKTKIKEEAERTLGKALTDQEFENWWKTQPTFVTFEDWLKQEEDMRKMGSKPCPSCGTLNSVTATVCHKCGSSMVEKEKPRRPPAKPPEEKPKEAVPAKREAVTPTPAKPEERPPAAVRPVAKKTLPTAERPVPKKVIKKPVVEGAPTVVPKKVVRRPDEEEEEEGS